MKNNKKNRVKYSEKCGFLMQDPPPHLKIHTFKKVWIGPEPPPPCGLNPHFYFFFYLKASLSCLYYI